MAGEHERIPTAPNPGYDCIFGRHLNIDIYAPEAGPTGGRCLTAVGGWCVWCGTGAYDPDRITDAGQPVGFTPTLHIRIPAGFDRVNQEPREGTS